MIQKDHAHTLIFLFELAHIESAERFLAEQEGIEKEGYAFVALDPEIEYVLMQKNISSISAGPNRTLDAEPRIKAADYAKEVMSQNFSFFTYRDVSLARTYTFSLQVYLTEVLYQTDIIVNILSAYPTAKRCVVFPATTAAPIMGSCWMDLWISIPIDTLKVVASASGREIIIGNGQAIERKDSNETLFTLKRTLFGLGIDMLNWAVVFRRPQKIRILVSDYWSNVEEIARQLDSVELICIDRLNAVKAGIKNIWKYRMRFTHLNAYASANSSKRQRAAEAFTTKWGAIKVAQDLPACTFRDIELRPLLTPFLDRVIAESVQKTLKDIDGAHEMLQKIRPHIVMLRATTSAQPHFSILAQAARAENIPSIEMLHGLDYYGPGSSYIFHEAEYVGIYGDLIKKQMAHLEPHTTKFAIIGSPRFDVYAKLQKEMPERAFDPNKKVVFLCIAPVAGAGDIDMYDIVEYFSAIAAILKNIPNVEAIIKLRPGPNRDAFVKARIKDVFAGVPYTIAQAEPLWDVFPRADVVISCFSTAALEALQCGKPVVYFGLSPSQKMLGKSHFSVYAEYGAIRMAETSEALQPILTELAASDEARKALSRKALTFLEQEFAFDGKASERTVALIESFAQQTHE